MRFLQTWLPTLVGPFLIFHGMLPTSGSSKDFIFIFFKKNLKKTHKKEENQKTIKIRGEEQESNKTTRKLGRLRRASGECNKESNENKEIREIKGKKWGIKKKQSDLRRFRRGRVQT